MPTARRALVVANDVYADAALARLKSAAADAEALQDVLGAREIGGFGVELSSNQASHEVQARIEDFFAEAKPEDLLLLYFSGHGLKAETGELFLAATNTRPSRLASSAVSADFVHRCMRTTRSRCVVLFLDCCYGGAFPQGAVVRAGGPVDVLSSFPEQSRGSGRGQAVITASTSMEYSFEGAALSDARNEPSVFTAAFVEGLRSGDADRDGDGLISLDELYDYLYDRVRLANPAQTPSRKFDLQGELHIAASNRRRLLGAGSSGEAVPVDLRAALQDADPLARLGAVSQLRRRLAGEDLVAAAAALATLRELAQRDVEQVASVAAAALRDAVLRVEPAVLVLPGQPQGTQTRHRIRLSGVPLARSARAHPDSSALTVTRTGDDLEVRVSWPPGEAGLLLDGPTGTLTVPIRVQADAPRPQAEEPSVAAPVGPPVAALVAAPAGTPVPARGLLRYGLLSPAALIVFGWLAIRDQFGLASIWSTHIMFGVAGLVAAGLAVREILTRRAVLLPLVIVVLGLLGLPITAIPSFDGEQFVAISATWAVAMLGLSVPAWRAGRRLLGTFCTLSASSFMIELVIGVWGQQTGSWPAKGTGLWLLDGVVNVAANLVMITLWGLQLRTAARRPDF